MKVRIKSEGIGSENTVIETETGETIEGVNRVEYYITGGSLSTCRLHMSQVGIDALAELEEIIPIVLVCPECNEELTPASWEIENGDWVKVWLCGCEAEAPITDHNMKETTSSVRPACPVCKDPNGLTNVIDSNGVTMCAYCSSTIKIYEDSTVVLRERS